MEPLLSIIIPAFIRRSVHEKQLSSAIDSVISQDENCEIIVVDDCSPLLVQYPKSEVENSRIRIVRHNTNRGMAAARNTGLSMARAQLVSFLGHDDELLPDTLQQRLKLAIGNSTYPDIRDNPHCVQGCGWLDVGKGSNATRTMRFAVASRSADDFFRGCWFSPGSAIIANRDFLFRQLGGFSETYRRLDSAEIFMRAALAGVGYIPTPVMGVKIGDRPNTPTRDIMHDCNLLAEDHLSSKPASVAQLTQRQRKLLRAFIAGERAKVALCDGDYLETALFSAQRILNWPGFFRRWTDTFAE